MNILTSLRFASLVLCSFIFTTSYAQKEEDYFITVWDLSLDASKNTSIEFWSLTAGDVNYIWETMPAGQSGSGKFSANETEVTISNLPASKTIKLKLAPQNLKRFYFQGSWYKYNLQLVDVLQWGNAKWASMKESFKFCINLNIIATDIPNLMEVFSMESMFYCCFKLNSPSNINKWNTQNVKNMSWLFYYATTFNQPISNWNTVNVTDLEAMFYQAELFNQRLDSLELNPAVDFGGKNFEPYFYMLNLSGIDCKNYSYTLMGWANNPNTPTNKLFGAAGLKYSPLAQAARDLLTKPVDQGGKGWIIQGDALSTEDCGLITANQEGVEQSVLSIFPNPAQDKLYLKNATEGTAYKIIDGLGREVNVGTCQNEEISIATLPSGLYTLVCGNRHFTFVKE